MSQREHAAAARANAFTVDVEDWFHVCGMEGPLAAPNWAALPSRVVETTQRLLDELDRAAIRGTFFVLGWVADRFPALVAQIQAAGHEVGSHGHLHRRVYEMSPGEFVDDVRRSVAALRAAGISQPAGFRAPEWSITERSLWALEHLVREGFSVDASMAPLRMVGRVDYPRHPHVRTTPAGPILEVPPLVADRFRHVMPLGWGWGLRMSSPRRLLETIAASNRAGIPCVLTVHPWELDPDPPRCRLPLRMHFAHYFRLNGFARRLPAVLRGADFGAVSDLAVARQMQRHAS